MNPNSFHISRTVAVLVALAVIIALAVGYTLMKNDESDSTVSVTGGAATASEANFVTLAGELDSIVFDTSIFSDPRFLALIDIHTAITPEVPGRNDPFAPLGR
ncbi:MAG: hypothetical protein AAB892_00715 [Patescibacteria group bacterium]